VWDVVRREAMQPSRRGWIRELHDLGEHFECSRGECQQWTAEDALKEVQS